MGGGAGGGVAGGGVALGAGAGPVGTVGGVVGGAVDGATWRLSPILGAPGGRALALIAAALIALVLIAPGARADGGLDVPTGGPPSPLFGAQPFTQKLLLFEEFGTLPYADAACPNCAPLPLPASCGSSPNGAALDAFLRQPLYPAPTREANTRRPNDWAPLISRCVRPLRTSAAEGRPPGAFFAHQRWEEFPVAVYFKSAQTGARVNGGLRDSYQMHHYSAGEFGPSGLYYNGGTLRGTQVRIHPNMPVQGPSAVWTFDGTLPPKLLMARYGEPILFRHFDALPVDPAANGGFGAHTITTHEHNGHNGGESDGYPGAFFFPGQFYDYHWPMLLAGNDTTNPDASDPRAGRPDGHGGVVQVPGDWRETMSTQWFHDHMLDFTAQNVYKGNAAMMNFYSAIDRGREGLLCNYANPANANLCLPSGTALDWGNRDYDVNLLVADKAWDARGQLWFNVFSPDGFIGDRMTVNWQYAPYMEVRARRYRFRILNGAVARFLKIAIVTESGQRVPFHLVASDGNIMEHSVAFPNAQVQDLPVQAIAERFDIVVDFSRFAPGAKIRFVNTLEHADGKLPNRIVPLADITSGRYRGDTAVGAFMEMRVVAYTGVDRSMNPADYVEGRREMIPMPTVTPAELASAVHHTFEFGRSHGTDRAPWTIKTDGGQGFNMDPHRVSAAPTIGQWQIWHMTSGGGWAHPIHIHFEEARILSRDGQPPSPWERLSRKDVFRIGGGPEDSEDLVVLIRFREFLGSYVEHCHNTMHEDTSMLLRWDNRSPGQVVAMPTPVPDWEGVSYEPSEDLPTAVAGDPPGNSGSGRQ